MQVVLILLIILQKNRSFCSFYFIYDNMFILCLYYVYDKLIMANSDTNTTGYYKNEYTSYIILI